jgi:hypothetical protein
LLLTTRYRAVVVKVLERRGNEGQKGTFVPGTPANDEIVRRDS